MFIINFEIRAGNITFCIFHAVNSGEKLGKGSLHKAIIFAHHGVGFAGSGLPIHEHTCVVAVEGVGEEFFADRLENVGLGGRWGKNPIKAKVIFVQPDL